MPAESLSGRRPLTTFSVWAAVNACDTSTAGLSPHKLFILDIVEDFSYHQILRNEIMLLKLYVAYFNQRQMSSVSSWSSDPR